LGFGVEPLFLFLAALGLLIAILPGFVFSNFMFGASKLDIEKFFDSRTTTRRIYLAYGLAIIIALFEVAGTLLEQFEGVKAIYFAVGTFCLFCLFLLMPFGTGRLLWIFDNNAVKDSDDENSPLFNTSVQDQSSDVKKDTTFFRALLTVDFWMIFYIFFGTIGTAIACLNNIPVVVVALSAGLQNGKTYNFIDLPGSSGS